MESQRSRRPDHVAFGSAATDGLVDKRWGCYQTPCGSEANSVSIRVLSGLRPATELAPTLAEAGGDDCNVFPLVAAADDPRVSGFGLRGTFVPVPEFDKVTFMTCGGVAGFGVG